MKSNWAHWREGKLSLQSGQFSEVERKKKGLGKQEFSIIA